MVNTWKRRLGYAALALVMAGGGMAANAQTKSVSWVVPAPPGGTLDSTGRMIAQKLGDVLGTHIVVENKPGGGGVVAAEYILNSNRADTIYLLEATQTMAGIIDQMVANIRYKPIEDLVPVHGLFYLPAVLVTSADSPFNTTEELIEYSRKKAGGLNLGTTGPGGVGHFYTSKYMTATGVDATLVHYKGSAPAMQDLIGGNFDAMFDFLSTAMPHIESGRLKAITVMSDSRLGSLPNVPTVKEDGFESALITGWVGAFVRKDTPREEISRLSAALAEVLRDPEVKALNERFGQIIMSGMGHDEFHEFNQKEYVSWGRVAQELGVNFQ